MLFQDTADQDMECDSGDDNDWVPETDFESSESDDSIAKGINLKALMNSNLDKADSSQDMHNQSSITPECSEAVLGVRLQLTNITTAGKRSPKLHNCYFCKKMYSRIARHYEQVHSNEMDVAKILCLPKKSKERKKMWTCLLNKGNYSHNYEVLEKKKGTIIPKYRPRQGEEQKHLRYAPCEFCLGSYVVSDLWKHRKSCPGKKADGKCSKGKNTPVQNGRLLLPIVGSSKGFYENIFIKMRDDKIKFTVQLDELIMSFAHRLYEKNGSKVHQHQYISQRVRELARLVIQIRQEHNDVDTITKVLLPSNWNKLICAVKAVAGFSDETGQFEIPSLSLKLGHSLSKCAKLLKAKAIIDNNEDGKKNAYDFLELYNCEWIERVSSGAHNTLHEAKFNKASYVPLAMDVHLLYFHLEEKSALLRQSLPDKPENYNEFAELCLAQIIVFNRKRSGEAQRIRIKDLEDGITEDEIPPDSEVNNSLSKFEKELCSSHKRIDIRGKRGSKVSVILTDSMNRNLECLLKIRKGMNIASEYLFMKTGSQHPIRGCDCLKKYAIECGAKFPQLLTSTKLRKHLATMTQVLGLKEGNQDLLAKFMGHDIRVHRQFYKLPDNILELAKVTKILHLINSGQISIYKGKDFDEIEFDERGNNLLYMPLHLDYTETHF